MTEKEDFDLEKKLKPRPDLMPPCAFRYLLTGSLFHKARCNERSWGLQYAVESVIGDLVKLSAKGAIWTIPRVMAYGRYKHGKCTWRIAGTEQADPETHYASMMRHLYEYAIDPEALEEGSGLSVLWHALTQAFITLDLLEDPPK